MGIRDVFRKEEKLDKEVKKVFDKIDAVLTAKRMVNEAISYRNLGKHDRAISLLKEVIRDYPVYVPAKTILGTTLAMSGDIDGAELQFNKILAEHAQGHDCPLIEVYANLGLLYNNHRQDIKTSLKYYQLALNAPRPQVIDDKAYEFMVSNVYKDLCLVYFKEQQFSLAKQFALQRLQTVDDCPSASRALGCCLFFELLQKGVDVESDTDAGALTKVLKYLQIALKANPMDHAVVAYSALTLFYVRHMKCWGGNTAAIETIEQREKEYFHHLRKYSQLSNTAMAAYQIYQDNVASFLSGCERG